MNWISKHTLTKIHPPTISNVSFTIHTPLQRTLHPTGPTIPDTYCINTLACNINPTIPQNIIQKFPAQFFGIDTSTSSIYLLPFYSHSPCTLLPRGRQRATRKTAVAILVPQFCYFNFHINFSCKLSVYIYIYICFLCMKIENKFYSILYYILCYHSPSQWSHSLALPSLYHQS